ncbi:uncharacterized protein LOC132939846 [Metopolophium dirhodum]|uniref:uncharacterized protein LOC132939846 n=1 Tax=Metopolophium dirhodum TaxID=44670 RepID=UPI00298FAEA7|nr:uncharacterized protein LOC132939846 [Metopolophium dirhodum]
MNIVLRKKPSGNTSSKKTCRCDERKNKFLLQVTIYLFLFNFSQRRNMMSAGMVLLNEEYNIGTRKPVILKRLNQCNRKSTEGSYGTAINLGRHVRVECPEKNALD